MKKLILIVSLFLMIFNVIQAQSVKNVTTDGTTPGWLGYANVFQTDGTSWEFGSAWAISDLKTIISGNTITVKPNFNTWKDNDPYWVTSEGKANKVLAGNTFIQKDKVTGADIDPSWFTDGTTNVEINFFVNVNSFDFPAGYKVEAFILVFIEDYSYNKPYTVEITGPGNYVVNVPAEDNELTDAHIQYGLRVTGLIADPVTESAIGGMQTSPSTLGVKDHLELEKFSIYPNPVTDLLQIKSQSKTITKVDIFSIHGQKLKEIRNNFDSINLVELIAGVYLVNIHTENGYVTKKLIIE